MTQKIQILLDIFNKSALRIILSACLHAVVCGYKTGRDWVHAVVCDSLLDLPLNLQSSKRHALAGLLKVGNSNSKLATRFYSNCASIYFLCLLRDDMN